LDSRTKGPLTETCRGTSLVSSPRKKLMKRSLGSRRLEGQLRSLQNEPGGPGVPIDLGLRIEAGPGAPTDGNEVQGLQRPAGVGAFDGLAFDRPEAAALAIAEPALSSPVELEDL